MLRSYRAKLIFFCALFGAFFIASQFYSYYASRKVVSAQLHESLMHAAQLFGARMQNEMLELQRHAAILAGTQRLCEYLFLVTKFDTGREQLQGFYQTEFGWLNVHRSVFISGAGEVVVGKEHTDLSERLAGIKNAQTFYVENPEGIELVAVAPMRYKEMHVGVIALTYLYGKAWIEMNKRLNGSEWAFERDGKLIDSTLEGIARIGLAGTFQDLRKRLAAEERHLQFYNIHLESEHPTGTSLWVGLSASPFYDRLRKYTLGVLTSSIAGTVIIIAFCWVLTSRLSRPLQELTYLTGEISKGRLPEVKRSSPNTEIEVLTNQFADMVSALRKKDVEVQLAHDQLRSSAVTDALTGLFNRRAFEENLQKAVLDARHEDKTHAVCFIDLDQFKIVNDACGHHAGDQLLVQFTALINAGVRGNDVLARIGGDEFGLLLWNVSALQAQRIAQQLLQIINEFKFIWNERVYQIGASIGLVSIDKTCADVYQVLSHADLACYSAKNEGRNCVYIYTESEQQSRKYRDDINWLEELRGALEEQRFVLWAQPIINLVVPNAEHMYELLIRLQRPDGSIVPPGAFIPAAERYNLMPAIDKWVINAAIDIMADFPQDDFRFFINLSALSIIKKETLHIIGDKLAYTGANPSRFCFEITETSAIHNLSNAIHLVEQVKALGCYFALDDFGAGLSSFRYLKYVPTDYIKLDGGYVQNINKTVEDHGMIEAIHKIAHLTGRKTIAECVEGPEVLARIKSMGIDYCQGYYTGRPAPVLTTLAEHQRVLLPAATD